VPFGTYTTFANAGLTALNYLTIIESGYGANEEGTSYNDAGDGFNFGFTRHHEGAGAYLDAKTYGLNSEVTEYSSSSNTLDSNKDWVPSVTNYTQSSFTTSGATSFTEKLVTVFIPNSGFELRGSFQNYSFVDSYDFTDPELNAFETIKETSTRETLTNFNIRSTQQTTISSTILDVATSWTDATELYALVPRAITSKSSSTTYGTGIGGDGIDIHCNYLSGLALVIQPIFGNEWTQDGGDLQYLQVFTSTGAYGPYYSNIIKDNQDSAYTVSASSSTLTGNIAYAITDNPNTVTIVSGSTQTITYEYITNGAGTTLTFPTQYSLNGAKFLSYQRSSTSFARKTTQSSTFSQILANEATFDVYGTDSVFSAPFFKTTKAIQISTTIQSCYTDLYLSYFSTFTYKLPALSTAESTYILFGGGLYGTYSSSQEFSDSYLSINPTYHGGITIQYSFQQVYFSERTQAPIPSIYYKRLYSLHLNTNIYASYTQNSPNFNFVVGGTTESVGGYRASLNPSNALTKLYFTTYNFERDGVVNTPILAIPINYTQESNSGTGSSYTYQSVNVPSEFCLGSSSASVYWTRSIAGATTYTTESFTLNYVGVDSILKSGYYNGLDEYDGAWSPIGYVVHTKGLVNTSSAASWSNDGYYYWKGSVRATSGTTSNAINPIGNGNPITYIGSEWVSDYDFPVVSILKNHINSYSY
jgi:hypothetical protein